MRFFTSLGYLRFCVIAAVCLALTDRFASAAGQTLSLDPKGSALTFIGESTLHNFRGEARDFTGSATLDPEANPPVQKASLHFKTAALTTFLDKRDQKMREWLKVDVHPDATFVLENVKLVAGDAEKASYTQPARFTVNGTLKTTYRFSFILPSAYAAK